MPAACSATFAQFITCAHDLRTFPAVPSCDALTPDIDPGKIRIRDLPSCDALGEDCLDFLLIAKQ